jgi:hypothetical protein
MAYQDPNITPFQYPIEACKTSNSAGSQLLIANTQDCSATPIRYRITATVAIAAAAVTATLELTQASLDGVVLTTTPASVTLRANSRLYLGTANAYISFPQEVTVTPTAAAVDIDPALTAIAVNSAGVTYAMQLLEKTTDLPINVEAETSSTRVLADGLQVTQNVTGLTLNSPVTFFTSPEDIAQFSVIQRSVLTTSNIYCLVTKTSGNLAFGTAKVLGISYTGDFSDEVASTTLNFQKWAVAHATDDVRVNSATQLAAINNIYKLCGLPIVA